VHDQSLILKVKQDVLPTPAKRAQPGGQFEEGAGLPKGGIMHLDSEQLFFLNVRPEHLHDRFYLW
jgi:hypothetical protein